MRASAQPWTGSANVCTCLRAQATGKILYALEAGVWIGSVLGCADETRTLTQSRSHSGNAQREIATLEMAFGLLHMLQAFIWYPGPGGAIDEFEDISNWVNVMRTADYILQTFIGDGIMVCPLLDTVAADTYDIVGL